MRHRLVIRWERIEGLDVAPLVDIECPFELDDMSRPCVVYEDPYGDEPHPLRDQDCCVRQWVHDGGPETASFAATLTVPVDAFWNGDGWDLHIPTPPSPHEPFVLEKGR